METSTAGTVPTRRRREPALVTLAAAAAATTYEWSGRGGGPTTPEAPPTGVASPRAPPGGTARGTGRGASVLRATSAARWVGWGRGRSAWGRWNERVRICLAVVGLLWRGKALRRRVRSPPPPATALEWVRCGTSLRERADQPMKTQQAARRVGLHALAKAKQGDARVLLHQLPPGLLGLYTPRPPAPRLPNPRFADGPDRPDVLWRVRRGLLLRCRGDDCDGDGLRRSRLLLPGRVVLAARGFDRLLRRARRCGGGPPGEGVFGWGRKGYSFYFAKPGSSVGHGRIANTVLHFRAATRRFAPCKFSEPRLMVPVFELGGKGKGKSCPASRPVKHLRLNQPEHERTLPQTRVLFSSRCQTH